MISFRLSIIGVIFAIAQASIAHAEATLDTISSQIQSLSSSIGHIETRLDRLESAQIAQNGTQTVFWTSNPSDFGKVMILPRGAITYASANENHVYVFTIINNKSVQNFKCHGSSKADFEHNVESQIIGEDAITFGCSSTGIRITFIPKESSRTQAPPIQVQSDTQRWQDMIYE